MRRDDPRHGTYAGAQQHQKEGKRLCPACRAAKAAYMREHRKVNKTYQIHNAARSRAIWRLVDLHREEFERLYVEEMAQVQVARMKRRPA